MQFKFFAFFALFLALAAVVEAGPIAALKKAKGSKKNNNVGNNNVSNNNVSNSTAANNNSTGTDNSNNNTASATNSAAAATRTRPCDQGDQSLAAALQANVIIGIGQQASVVTLQGLAGGAQADVQTAVDRLNQFMNTSSLQLQVAAAIADEASLAQGQLSSLQSSLVDQQNLISSLTGTAADNDTLSSLLDSFVTSTGLSQDGAGLALVDCFLPLTAVSA